MSNSFLFTAALLRTNSFVFFAVHETCRIFLSPFISKASRHVSSFSLKVHLSQPYVATGHTSAFISHIFFEIGMLWLFHILCSDVPIVCPLFNLARNSVVHSPSSVIRDPRYGNAFICSREYTMHPCRSPGLDQRPTRVWINPHSDLTLTLTLIWTSTWVRILTPCTQYYTCIRVSLKSKMQQEHMFPPIIENGKNERIRATI